MQILVLLAILPASGCDETGSESAVPSEVSGTELGDRWKAADLAITKCLEERNPEAAEAAERALDEFRSYLQRLKKDKSYGEGTLDRAQEFARDRTEEIRELRQGLRFQDLDRKVQEYRDRLEFDSALLWLDLSLNRDGWIERYRERLREQRAEVVSEKEKLVAMVRQKLEAAIGEGGPSSQQRAAKDLIEEFGDPIRPYLRSVSTAQFPEVTGLEFQYIPGGAYEVGTPIDELGRRPEEAQVHEVRIPAYFISVTEVTQEAFLEVTHREWDSPRAPRLPAHSVSYDEALEFCRLLSEKDPGFEYDLPTEVQWEIAARGGLPPSKYPFGFADEHLVPLKDRTPKERDRLLLNYAFFYAKGGKSQISIVGRKAPNRIGLYDVYGNVNEWCRQTDDYGEAPTLTKRVCRGGSVFSKFMRCRAGARHFEQAGNQSSSIGFRIVARSRK